MMEIYKTLHGTIMVEGERNLSCLHIVIDQKIHELEENKKFNRLEIKSVSIASSPAYDLGGPYTAWNACITYSHVVDNTKRK